MTRLIDRLNTWPERHPTLDKFLTYLFVFESGFICGVLLITLTIHFYGGTP
jgi:hypothetical protein